MIYEPFGMDSFVTSLSTLKQFRFIMVLGYINDLSQCLK